MTTKQIDINLALVGMEAINKEKYEIKKILELLVPYLRNIANVEIHKSGQMVHGAEYPYKEVEIFLAFNIAGYSLRFFTARNGDGFRFQINMVNRKTEEYTPILSGDAIDKCSITPNNSPKNALRHVATIYFPSSSTKSWSDVLIGSLLISIYSTEQPNDSQKESSDLL